MKCAPRCLGVVVLGLLASTERFGLPSAALRAGESDAKQAVSKLLEVGWGDSFRALEPAREEFEKARAAAPRDPRVSYAWALIQIKHSKHADAAKTLDEVLSLDPKHLPSREGKIWIDFLLKRYPAALVQMDQLAAQLSAKDDGLTDDAKLRQRETARYLGRLFGFLEGPAEKAINQDRVADAKKGLIARLSADHQKEFEAGRKSVADRFAEFHLIREQTKETEAAAQKKTQEETAKRLAGDKAAISTDKEAIAKQAALTREQLDKFLSDIERKLSPLDKEYARLSALGVSVRERIIDLDRDIDRLVRLASITEDPVLAARYRIEAERVADLKSRSVIDYRSLEGQAGRVRAQQAALLNERDATLARFNFEAKRLGQEQVKLAQTEKRIAREEDKNRKTPTGSSDRVYVMSQRASAFTNYEAFPLEQSKARLLESFR